MSNKLTALQRAVNGNLALGITNTTILPTKD
jgi:hypothetical protein